MSTGGVHREHLIGVQVVDLKIVDDSGDATLLIHEGVNAIEEYAKTSKFPDPNSTDNVEFQLVLTIIKNGFKSNPLKYTKIKERLVGVSE